MSKIIAIALKDIKIRSSGKTELLFFLILPLDIYRASFRDVFRQWIKQDCDGRGG